MNIKDIAKLSGYGIGTVSRVLNNKPNVSSKAREEILKIEMLFVAVFTI